MVFHALVHFSLAIGHVCAAYCRCRAGFACCLEGDRALTDMKTD